MLNAVIINDNSFGCCVFFQYVNLGSEWQTSFVYSLKCKVTVTVIHGTAPQDMYIFERTLCQMLCGVTVVARLDLHFPVSEVEAEKNLWGRKENVQG